MSLAPGERLAHYRLVEKIGEGGMGQVYRAWDERLERPVAIKLVSERAADDAGARARLQREARLASALNHPNICVIHEVNEAGDQPYIVMEFIEGHPLGAEIVPGGLPLTVLARHGAQIADALVHAHGHGVVHRDLKCSNVVITPSGLAKVLDFGLAKRASEAGSETDATLSATPLTSPGMAIGTLENMPPEVLRGRPSDERGDLWALGVILYELASGTHPFRRGTAFEAAAVILGEDPAPLPPPVDPGLREIVGRCLTKDPSLRMVSAAEVKQALERLAATPSAPGVPAQARPPRRRARKSRSIRALAVLPLANLSGDASQEYFADGMTEAIISGLARIGRLRVISRTSAMAYKGVRKPLPEIARELNVDAIVEGSVLRSEDQVRIHAQLVLAATDEPLWSETYDRPLADVLALQSDVARAIAREIQVKLTPKERAILAQPRRVDPAAYEAYLRGRFAWNKRTEPGMRQAIGYFEQALEADPTYALAHAGMADCYSVLGFWGFLPPADSFGRAKAAASRALALDKDLAEAHCALAYSLQHYDHDWAAAENSYQTALRLNPGYPTGHHFHALLCLATGRTRQAVEEMEKAESLDPLSRIIMTAHGWVLFHARQHDQAIRQFRKTIDLEPGFWVAREWLGRSLAAMGRLDEAVAECRLAVAAEGAATMSEASLAYVLARAGKHDEARLMFDQLADASRRRYVMPTLLAVILAGLEEDAAALDWLDKAVAEGGSQLCYLQVEPAFDRLHDHPRFRAIVEKLGLPQPGPASRSGGPT